MFALKLIKKVHRIKPKKFADHPIRVCRDPKSNRKIVRQLRFHISCSPCNDDGDAECGKYHCNTQHFPDHAPAYIFKEPENDMHIFHFAKPGRNYVRGCTLRHEGNFMVK